MALIGVSCDNCQWYAPSPSSNVTGRRARPLRYTKRAAPSQRAPPAALRVEAGARSTVETADDRDKRVAALSDAFRAR